MNKRLKPGDTWRPYLKIYDKDENGNLSPKDCTGHTVVLFIKRTQNETADDIKQLTITWDDQENGKGYFDLDHTTSKTFTGYYWWMAKLYKTADNSVVKTFPANCLYKLTMVTTLEKDI